MTWLDCPDKDLLIAALKEKCAEWREAARIYLYEGKHECLFDMVDEPDALPGGSAFCSACRVPAWWQRTPDLAAVEFHCINPRCENYTDIPPPHSDPTDKVDTQEERG